MDLNDYREFGDELRRTVSDAVDSQNYDKLGENISRLVNTALTAAGDRVKKAGTNIKNSFSPPAPAPARYPVNINAVPSGYGMAPLILGILGASVFFTAAFAALVIGAFASRYAPAAVLAACSAACVFIAVRGYRSSRLKKRSKRYLTLMSRSDSFLLRDIAAAYPLPENQVAKDLKKLTALGFFPEGHTDGGYFICSNETYSYYRRALDAETAAWNDPELSRKLDEAKEAVEKGRRYIEGIRMANVMIADRDMSDKLDITEKLLRNIFDRLEKRPELIGEARRLIEYYLPMIEKLLTAYTDLARHEIETENIKKSMTEIENSMDSVNVAFYNLYNELFLDDKVDIVSDISVLKNLLAGEGLSDSDFKQKG